MNGSLRDHSEEIILGWDLERSFWGDHSVVRFGEIILRWGLKVRPSLEWGMRGTYVVRIILGASLDRSFWGDLFGVWAWGDHSGKIILGGAGRTILGRSF